jgi:site-specific DNA-methyltransferase (adenine-specific)
MRKNSESLRNKFYCGDALKLSKRHIQDGQIDLIITDPPYGISGQTLDTHYHRDESMVVGDYVEWQAKEYAEKTNAWIEEAERILRPGGSIYVVSGYTHLSKVLTALSRTGLEEINHVIWKYQFGPSTTKKFVSSHCHVLYYWKPGGERTWNQFSRFGQTEKTDCGRSKQYKDLEDVWLINRENKPGQSKNKNELPVQLVAKMIQYSSNEKDLICDFFLGGFTTAKVAKGLGRYSCGFEISDQSFIHGLGKWKDTVEGYLSSGEADCEIPFGKNDRPRNQGKPISEQEREQIIAAFVQGKVRKKSKKQIMEEVMSKHGRGLQAIEKILKSAGGWSSLIEIHGENQAVSQ